MASVAGRHLLARQLQKFPDMLGSLGATRLTRGERRH